MNCFDWHNRASDYLDGTLAGSLKSDADEHLDSCQECADRCQHYRLLLSSVSSLPRSTLPIPIRKAPFSVGLPRLDVARLGRSRWDQIPWYLRTSIEGAGIVLMILLGISAGPRLRSIYERSIEANLAEFTQSFREWRDSGEGLDGTAPLTRGKSVQASADGGLPQAQDEFSSGDGDSDSDSETADEEDSGASDTLDGDIRVGRSEIWRFIVKTDSPHEIRPRIVKLLTDLKVPSNTPGLGGVEAPGGIQFDLLVPQTVVPSIKRQLQAMAPKAPQELAQSPAGETFTWYKNKSKRKIAPQKTRVVIWLSQM